MSRHRIPARPRFTGLQVRLLFAMALVGALAASQLLPGGAA